MKTPHISLRVPKDDLERWRTQCELANSNISTTIRVLMDAWCEYQENLQMDDELMGIDIDQIKEEYGIK